jgi:hypothetical protein
MDTLGTKLNSFFGVVIRPQSYLNALYLLLAFPLGLFYFIFLVVGLSLGVSLAIVWIGLVILVAVFAAWYGLAAFERQMAIWLLREEIPPMVRPDVAERSSSMTLWQKFTSALTNSVTWKGLFYLAAKFPLGILSFVVLVTLLSTSAALVAAPFYYMYVNVPANVMLNNTIYTNSVWYIDTPFEAALASIVGLLLLVVSLHVFNGLAWFSGKFARVMLGNFQPVPVAPPPPAQISAPHAEVTGPQVYETAASLEKNPPEEAA